MSWRSAPARTICRSYSPLVIRFASAIWAITGDPESAALTLVIWFDTMPPGSLRGLVLASSDLDADYQRLQALGAAFDQAPVEQPWATEAVLRDPDGNQLVLQQT